MLLWRKKQKERREQKFLEKEARAAEKLLQQESRKRSKSVLPTPLSMEGHPVDPETGEVLAEEPFTESFPEAEIVAPATPEDLPARSKNG